MSLAERIAKREQQAAQAVARSRAWAASHPEEMRAHHANYRAKHRKPRRPRRFTGAEVAARWRRAHPERAALSAAMSRAARRARERCAEGRCTADDVVAQLNQQCGRCFYCHEPLTKYHIDHKTPLARGGTNWPDNIVIACPPCNQRKGAKTAEEFTGGGK